MSAGSSILGAGLAFFGIGAAVNPFLQSIALITGATASGAYFLAGNKGAAEAARGHSLDSSGGSSDSSSLPIRRYRPVGYTKCCSYTVTVHAFLQLVISRIWII